MLLSLLVFLAVSVAVIATVIWLVPSRTDARVRALTVTSDAGHWQTSFARIAGPLAKLSAPRGNWEDSPLRLRFLNAGIRHERARTVYFAAKTVLPVVFGALAYMAIGRRDGQLQTMLLWVILSATLGCFLPNLVVLFKARARRREIFENFPDAADLLLICVEAGMGLDAALLKVTEEIRLSSLPMAEELHLTNLEIRAGATREKALRNLALRTAVDEVSAFAVMLTQADKFGTSIGDSLRVFSDDLRHKRQARAEEKAAKVPTKLLFPLVTCIFPSIVMVILGPAVIQIIRTLLPALTRH